jgi:pentatricopeptide repeat protein
MILTDDINLTSAEAATAKLAELSAAYRGPEPSATPSNPQETQARLKHLTTDKAWGERLAKGDVAATKEFKALTEQVASGDQPLAFETEVVDALTDPNAMPRETYNGLIAGLREQGMLADAEQYLRDLDSGARTDRPTAGDGLACKQALDRLSRDAAFARAVFDGDVAANALRTALGNVIAMAADDGKPVSEAVQRELSTINSRWRKA